MNIPSNESVFVIFGITGDLAKRKLLPALYRLEEMHLLTPEFTILGTTRQSTTVSDVLEVISESIGDSCDESILERLRSRIQIVHMNIAETSEYDTLKQSLITYGKDKHWLFYLAVPPEMFTKVVTGLGSAGLQNGYNAHSESRLLIEKPFGHDLTSAKELIGTIESVFSESSVYRVDHYLAKETAQNILTFRTSNPIFKSVWDSDHIQYIAVSATEKIGIEGRVNFYEKTGALRDIIQSHLLQLLALVTMEEPDGKSADAIHDAKLQVLRSIAPAQAQNAVRGQYEGYVDEVNNPESITETFAAVTLSIDNDRWRGVPIYLQSGKAMHAKLTEITIVFNTPDCKDEEKNILTFSIQPNEGIQLSLRAKKPSLNDETQTVHMDFNYAEAFMQSSQPDAYERVLVDAIKGDKTLFTTDDEVLRSWEIVEPLLNEWSTHTDIESYSKGSRGPDTAHEMLSNDGADWHIAE